MSLRLEGLDHVALTVADQAASERWYRDVLGLERRFAEVWGDMPIMLMSGGSGVALFPAKTGSERTVSGIRVAHVAFRVDRAALAAAQERLRELGVPLVFQDHGASRSIYFSDPDGHELELTTYEI